MDSQTILRWPVLEVRNDHQVLPLQHRKQRNQSTPTPTRVHMEKSSLGLKRATFPRIMSSVDTVSRIIVLPQVTFTSSVLE